MKLFLSIYFGITLLLLGIEALAIGIVLFFVHEGAIGIYMYMIPICVIESILGIILILLFIVDHKFRYLKVFVYLKPWIVQCVLLFPLYVNRLVSNGKDEFIGTYFNYIWAIAYLCVFVFTLKYFLWAVRLNKSNERKNANT